MPAADAPGRIAGRRVRLGPATVPPPEPRSARCDGEAVVPPWPGRWSLMRSHRGRYRTAPILGGTASIAQDYLCSNRASHWYWSAPGPRFRVARDERSSGSAVGPLLHCWRSRGLLPARARGPVQPRSEPAPPTLHAADSRPPRRPRGVESRSKEPARQHARPTPRPLLPRHRDRPRAPRTRSSTCATAGSSSPSRRSWRSTPRRSASSRSAPRRSAWSAARPPRSSRSARSVTASSATSTSPSR